MTDYFQILCGIVVLLLSVQLYNYYSYITNYWKKLKVSGPRPHIFFGNFKEVVVGTLSINECVKKFYDEYKHEPVVGIFDRKTPLLIVNDLNLIKDVLIKDFSVFADRGITVNTKVDPLADHLFLLEPKRWRPMRTSLSPVFTSGKLKEMFPLMVECSMYLDEYLAKVADKGEPVNCNEIAARFTTDVIGNCAFGIEMSALANKDSEFRRMGKKALTPTAKTFIKSLLRQFLPGLYNMIGHLLQTEGVKEFFTGVVVDTIKYRKENGVYRPDFINALMELREHPEKLQNIELTDTFLTAQAFVFFLAGFETSSSTIAHALYELAQNHDIQDKLREEIKQSDEKHGKTLTYDNVKAMKYLDKVFKETLRKYPVVATLMRKSSEQYTFKGTNITIPKGTAIWISSYGIQLNPDIYPNPDIFDPSRFDEDAVAARHSVAYLSFGDGPRNCIGARFGNFQTKVGIVTVLRNYKVDVCEKTTIPYKADPRSFLLSMKGGIYLKITRV